MAIQWSTVVRNARLDAIETAIGVSAILRLYSGTPPANVAAALAGNTLLAEFDLAADWAAAASGGVKALNNVPLATTGAVGAGAGTIATFYRIYASDGTTCHEQGTVSITGGGGDAIIDNTSIANGQNVQVTSFSKTEPGA